jgi:hypothetical protein
MLDDPAAAADAPATGQASRPSVPSIPSIKRIGVVLLFLALAAFLQSGDVVGGVARVEAPGIGRPSGRFGRRGFGPRMDRGTPRPGQRVTPAEARAYGGAPLYDLKTLRTIFIEFPKSNWESELESNYRRDVDVAATVSVDGATYKDVGVRFRGNSSYRMVPSGFKRSLNLAFDEVHADQAIAGYRTLNLLNANSDPTFMRAMVFSEIARKYLPAPKVNFVRVVINGENWGVFINSQQFNKDFLRDFYGDTKGVRWKVPGSPRGRGGLEYLGDDAAAYKGTYELKTKDTAKSWADLVRVCRLLNMTRPEHLEAVLAPHLDIDGALKFLALDVALVNTDGYWTRASDYSLYQDGAGRFHVLPYDFNEAIGVQGGGRRGFGGGHGGPTLDPLVGLDDATKPLRSKLLAVPALRERYLTYVRDIAEKWMDWKALAPVVTEAQALIEAEVKADGRKLYSFEEFGTTALQRFLDERRAFLLSDRSQGVRQ